MANIRGLDRTGNQLMSHSLFLSSSFLFLLQRNIAYRSETISLLLDRYPSCKVHARDAHRD